MSLQLSSNFGRKRDPEKPLSPWAAGFFFLSLCFFCGTLIWWTVKKFF